MGCSQHRRVCTLRMCVAGLLLLVAAGAAQASDFASPAEVEQRVTLDLRDVEIGRALEIVGRASGLNMVVGSGVHGRVTVYLKDVPWQQALDSVLRANGYGYVRQGNIIRIDKLDALRRERELRLRQDADADEFLTGVDEDQTRVDKEGM